MLPHNITKSNRMGRFEVSIDFVNHHPDIVQRIMSNMLIVRAEMMFTTDVIEYQAFSEFFDVIPKGEKIPLYEISLDGDTVDIKREGRSAELALPADSDLRRLIIKKENGGGGISLKNPIANIRPKDDEDIPF